jgi:hypothetical protein
MSSGSSPSHTAPLPRLLTYTMPPQNFTAAGRPSPPIRSSGASPSLPSSQVSPPCSPFQFGVSPSRLVHGTLDLAVRRRSTGEPAASCCLVLPSAAAYPLAAAASVYRAMSSQDLSTPESNQANNGQPRPLRRHFAENTLWFLISHTSPSTLRNPFKQVLFLIIRTRNFLVFPPEVHP